MILVLSSSKRMVRTGRLFPFSAAKSPAGRRRTLQAIEFGSAIQLPFSGFLVSRNRLNMMPCFIIDPPGTSICAGDVCIKNASCTKYTYAGHRRSHGPSISHLSLRLDAVSSFSGEISHGRKSGLKHHVKGMFSGHRRNLWGRINFQSRMARD